MDHRDMAHSRSGWFRLERDRIVFETGEGTAWRVPCRFEVCGSCDGRGRYVNPSIDAHGLTADDFAEDPDFAEDYFRGVYDVTCDECRGQRVVPVPVECAHTTDNPAPTNDADEPDCGTCAFHQEMERAYDCERERQHEIRMGY